MSSAKVLLALFFLLIVIAVGGRLGLRIPRSTETAGESISKPGEGLSRFFQDPTKLIPGLSQNDAEPNEGLGVTRAKNQIAIPTKSPEELPPNVQAIRKQLYANPLENHNGDLLLAKSAAWVIEYIPTPELFLVTIVQDPADTAKNQAVRWFLNAGLLQEDLCDLPVRFLLGNEQLRRTNINFTSLPNGCE